MLNYKLADIAGIDITVQGGLAQAGITTVQQFLDRTATAEQRLILSQQLGVSLATLEGWIQAANTVPDKANTGMA